jgi:hypothetical protein
LQAYPTFESTQSYRKTLITKHLNSHTVKMCKKLCKSQVPPSLRFYLFILRCLPWKNVLRAAFLGQNEL